MNYTSSDLFVGRSEEKEQIHQFIDSLQDRILCIHSAGRGGLGKTQILLRLYKEYSKQEESFVFELIDFYLPDMQRRIGLIEKISEQKPEQFKDTREEITKYRNKEENQVLDQFKQEFKCFAASKSKVIFLFDSYEHIQHVIEAENKAEATDYSSWLETEFIPLVLAEKNAHVIVAGRHQPTALSLPFESIAIRVFDEADSIDFLTQALQKQGGRADSEMKELHRLTQGQPILLALAVDWLLYSGKAVAELIKDLEPDTFKERIIDSIKRVLSESDYFLKYITVACYRLNAEILQHLIGESLEDCTRYIEKARKWSFVKPKGEDTIILHDVMRSYLEEYLSNADRGFLAENTKDLLKYYEDKFFGDEDKLDEAAQEKYILELVNYAFRLDFDMGVDTFCGYFDQIMEDGRYAFASDFLLKAAEDWRDTTLNYRNKGESSLNFLQINARRIEYETETYSNHSKALNLADEIIKKYKEDPRWKDSAIQGLILLKKGTALFGLVRFTEAIAVLKEARKLLLSRNESVNAYWTDNWIGYSYYQLGDFTQAEEFLKKSKEGFYKIIQSHSFDTNKENEYRIMIQGYQITLVNLSLIYFFTGRLYTALQYARIYYHIAQKLPRNDREIARAQETFAMISWFMGYRHEAKQYLNDSKERAKNDPLLTGRIEKESLRQQFHDSGLYHSSFIEYYDAKNFKEIIKEINGHCNSKTVQNLERIGNTKELLLAYCVQANLCLLKLDISFKEIESILCKVSNQDTFQYEKARALKNLVRLCYFASAWDTDDARKLSEKFLSYTKQFEDFEQELKAEGIQYPELSARYQVVLGNSVFDKALKTFNIERVEEALQHYLNAADYVKDYKVFRHHPFQIIRHRLVTFILEVTENRYQDILKGYPDIEKRVLAKGNYEKETRDYFNLVFKATEICLPNTSWETIENFEKKLLDFRGNLPKKIIQIKCLTDTLRILGSKKNLSQEERIQWLFKRTLWLMEKARLYRRLRTGNRDFALRAYGKAEKVIKELEKEFGENAAQSAEILSLKGRLAAGRGTVQYRQDPHEELLEFYIQGELKEAKKNFNNCEKNFNEAGELLFEGIKQLKKADNLVKSSSYIEDLSKINKQWLGAAYFRIGELKWLQEEFDDALDYLAKAITSCNEADYLYRKLDAMESYVTTVYFKKEWHQTIEKYNPLCTEYIKEIEENSEKHPLICAKLRITQGDEIFTRLFVKDEEHSNSQGIYIDNRYTLREKKLDSESIDKMMQYYIESCKFMKQTPAPRNFLISLLILIRRIGMISEESVVKQIYPLLNKWMEHEKIKDYKHEISEIQKFSMILHGIIKKS
jgi:tetratricopeptide (TPR) repeat protein